MPNLKRIFSILIIGGIGGVLATVFIFPLLARTSFLGAAAILDKIYGRQPAVTKVEEKTIVISQSEYFSEAIKKIEPSVVAVQSFSGGQLVRSGSGIVLTQDGLIATTGSVIPAGAGVIQVFSGGEIYKAKLVFRDYTKNIALISVAKANFQVTGLKSDLPGLGQELLIFSKLVSFGRENPFVIKALVSRIDENSGAFEISAPYDYRLYGSVLINGEGNVLGVIDFKNQKPIMTFSKLIEDALNAYLAGFATSSPSPRP